MQRVQRLLRSFDRVQQRSRWLGFPLAVMGKFRDDHGGALTTVIAYNAFFAFFPLLLVVVTVLGFLLGRDSGLQQRLLGSAVADFPIIGDQVQDNIHGLRGSGVGLVIGLAAFAWGARGLTQVAQHAMAEIWNIPGRQRPGFWARQVRGLLLLVVFAVGLAATSLLTWLGSYGGKAVRWPWPTWRLRPRSTSGCSCWRWPRRCPGWPAGRRRRPWCHGHQHEPQTAAALAADHPRTPTRSRSHANGPRPTPDPQIRSLNAGRCHRPGHADHSLARSGSSRHLVR